MLTAALMGGHMMRKLHQPAVLGELMAGILVGPTVFGLIAPNLFGALFAADAKASLRLDAVIKIGMLFFLFVAGLEVNVAHIWQRSSGVILTSTLGILVPLILGIGSVLLLPQLWAPHSPQQNWILALFVGTALSSSALPVIARILMDLDLIQQEIGGIVLTAATINDLIGWSLFAVVLSIVQPASPAAQSIWTTLGLIAGFLISMLIVGSWLSRPILRRSRSALVWPSGFIGLITILVLVAAVIAEGMGIHVSNILGKLHLANRTQAALYAFREGLTGLDLGG